jgi:hypothetical protein
MGAERTGEAGGAEVGAGETRMMFSNLADVEGPMGVEGAGGDAGPEPAREGRPRVPFLLRDLLRDLPGDLSGEVGDLENFLPPLLVRVVRMGVEGTPRAGEEGEPGGEEEGESGGEEKEAREAASESSEEAEEGEGCCFLELGLPRELLPDASDRADDGVAPRGDLVEDFRRMDARDCGMQRLVVGGGVSPHRLHFQVVVCCQNFTFSEQVSEQECSPAPVTTSTSIARPSWPTCRA